MQKLRVTMALLLTSLVLSSGAIISGCSSSATPEQLQRISELKREISSLESAIQTKQNQIGQLDRQISAMDAKLTQCAKDKDLVRQRLANWQGE